MLGRFGANVEAMIKSVQVAPRWRGNPCVHLLTKGFLVAVFVGRTEKQLGPDGAHDETLASTTRLADCCVHYLHIGWQWRKPWESLWHIELPGKRMHAGLTLSDFRAQEVLLKSSLQAAVFYKGLYGVFNAELHWDVAWFVLKRDCVPTGLFRPGYVRAEPLGPLVDDSDLFLVWNPFASEAAQAPNN